MYLLISTVNVNQLTDITHDAKVDKNEFIFESKSILNIIYLLDRDTETAI